MDRTRCVLYFPALAPLYAKLQDYAYAVMRIATGGIMASLG